ncbi:MAG: ATP12 family protein [Pseudomonadota bacterium]
MIPKTRFWTHTEVTEDQNGFGIALDGRPLKTPTQRMLNLPNAALAKLVADEWDAVEDAIDPAKLPATRMTNSAIDTVSVRRNEVLDMLAGYATNDLLCYWADGPDGLVGLQKTHWQPVLDWVAGQYNLCVATTVGIMPIAQDERLREAIYLEMNHLSDFAIAGLHDVIVLSGSAFLTMAWLNKYRSTDAVWTASRVDAAWQISQWGEDEDEARLVAQKRGEFTFAAKYCTLASGSA